MSQPTSNTVKKYSFSIVKNFTMLLLAYVLLSSVINYFRAPNIQPSPRLQGTTLAGEPVDLTLTLKQGKPVLLYIWGSWCPVCRTTSNTVNDFAKRDDVTVISIASLSGDDTELTSHMTKKGYGAMLTHTINDADGALMKRFGVQVTPTIILLKQRDKTLKAQALTGYRSATELKFRLWWLS